MKRPSLLDVALAAAAGAVAVAQVPAPRVAPPIIVNNVIATIDMGPLPDGVGVQGIALNADRSRVYVAQANRTTRWNGTACSSQGLNEPTDGNGGVGVFDTTTRQRVTTLSLSSGFPVHVELDGSTGRIYAAASPDWVYAFDGTTQVASRNVGAVPHDIGIDTVNGRGVVTNTSGPGGNQQNLTLVTLPDLAIVSQFDSGGFGPHKAAVDSERHLAYVSHADYNRVTVVDTATGSVRSFNSGLASGGAQNAIDLARRRLYVVGNISQTNAGMRAINLETETPLSATLTLPFGGHGMRVDTATGYIWVVLEENHQVAVVDPNTLQERLRVNVGHCPYYLDIDTERRLAYVTNQGDNTISVVDMTVDGAGPSISISDATVTEGNSGTTNASFTLSLSGASSQTVTVSYATANETAAAGRDFTAASGTLTFAPGTTSQSITVAVTGDAIVENAETFLVTLSNPSAALLAESEAVGTISNDDSFTDDPLTAVTTTVRGVHLTQLRTNVNLLRSGHNLSTVTWTDDITAGSTVVKAVHLTELRNALNAVYEAAGVTAPTYAESLTAGSSVIKASHITELRNAIRNAP